MRHSCSRVHCLLLQWPGRYSTSDELSLVSARNHSEAVSDQRDPRGACRAFATPLITGGRGGTHSTPAGWLRISRRSWDRGGDSWRAKGRVVPRGVTARTFDSAAAVGRKYLGLALGDVIWEPARMMKIPVELTHRNEGNEPLQHPLYTIGYAV